MIDGADFLKWCEIFQVNRGSPGGPVDLQDAYNNGDGSILENSGKPVVFKDMVATGSSSSLFDLFSTTKGSRPFPSMTTAQRNAIVSPATGLTIYNTSTNQLNYYNGATWVIIESGALTLQDAYDNGDGTITVLNNNTKPFSVGNDETNIFGPYGVYVSAIRNLETLPTQFWFQFFEANDSTTTMVQYGAIACQAKSTTAGSVAGLTAMGAARNKVGGEVLPFLFADGLNDQSISAYPLLISDNPSSVVDLSSMLDIVDSSNTKGSRPYPSLTTTQRDAIVFPATGLSIYNSTTNTIDYYDGVAWQTILTIDNVLAGTNMTIVQNGDGTITLNSSGGGSGNISSYAGWAFGNGGTSTTFSADNTYVPIIIAVSLNDIISSNFVNEVATISGNNTPCFRYIGAATQNFEFNLNLYVRGAVAAQKTYQFQVSIERADTSIVQTGFISGDIVLQDLIFPYAIPLSGIVQLNTGDRVYVSVQNKTDTSSVVVQAGNADILNVDATDNLDSRYFQIVNNFSELAGVNTDARGNLGIGTGVLELNLDQDYTITNPAPKEIIVDMPTADHTADLPPSGAINSLAEGEFILIKSTPTSQNLFFTIGGNPGFEINANEIWSAFFTPSISQTEWTFIKQSGSGATVDMQSSYNAGSIVAMTEGQPVQFAAGETFPGDALYLTTLYSAAFFSAPPSSEVIGMSFTMNQDGVISALSYADTAFSSGTREVGLWEYTTPTTGVLLATANVAKGDPLDSKTGKFRVHAITPVSVSNGARYVVAELNPTTDQWLGYSGPNPVFANVDGWSQTNFTSATLVYPPIVNLAPPGGTQWGNASLEFQPVTGYSSVFNLNTLADDPAFIRVNTVSQVCQPFGIGTTAQRDAISTTFLQDGDLWNNTDSKTIDRWSSLNNVWIAINLGNLDVGTSTFNLVNNVSHNIYYAGNCVTTLPTSSPVNSIIELVLAGSTSLSWRVSQNAGQTIFAANNTTTTGTGGYLLSTSPFAVVCLKTVIADTNFVVINSFGTFSTN